MHLFALHSYFCTFRGFLIQHLMIRRTLFDLHVFAMCLALSCVQVKVTMSGHWFDNMRPEDRRKNYVALARGVVCQRDELPRNRPRSCVHARGYTLPRDGRRRGGWRTSRLAETHTLLLLFLFFPGHIALVFLTISNTGLIVKKTYRTWRMSDYFAFAHLRMFSVCFQSLFSLFSASFQPLFSLFSACFQPVFWLFSGSFKAGCRL